MKIPSESSIIKDSFLGKDSLMHSKIINKVLPMAHALIDLLLLALALILSVEMINKLLGIFKLVVEQKGTLAVIDQVLLLFLLFEFIVMIFTYIKEEHHIPVNMLIYITITSILRHTIGEPGTAFDTLLISLAILVLSLSIVLLKYFRKRKS